MLRLLRLLRLLALLPLQRAAAAAAALRLLLLLCEKGPLLLLTYSPSPLRYPGFAGAARCFADLVNGPAGPRRLFAGAPAAFGRGVPGAALTLVVYDAVMDVLVEREGAA